jgi:Na+/H+-dicarboxylate symporter
VILSTRILLGLGLGVAAGLFFGEAMSALEVVGDAFLRLLRMTVMPYVMVSLVVGLGRLDYAQARSLAVWGGGLLLLLWAISFAMVAVMPLAFPPLESASFFSTTLVERAPPIDFVELYIPSNPFHSLANNVVPAVVIFSLAVGIALIGMDGKDSLLRGLHTLGGALLRVTNFVVRLTPIGVFAIAANAAGTMSIDEFQRVQVYLVSYVAFALITTFWVLPGLLSALTPMGHREVLSQTRDAMITAFATGSSFVVIPLLANHSKELLRRYSLERESSDSLVDVIIPASLTFPHAAKVLSLSFVMFAGWFVDAPVPFRHYATLALAGIASTFASVNTAIPFLLDLMRLPHDLFQLFVATSVLNSRFGSLLAAMHVLVLTLLGTCALSGTLVLRWRPLVRWGVGTLLIVFVTLLAARALFAYTVDTTYRRDQVVRSMRPVLETVSAIVHRDPPPTPPLEPGRTRLESIVGRGVVRVGYVPEGGMPWVYFTARGDLVGLDVEMAHSLARGLGVTLEFVPLETTFALGGVAEALDSGYCDIVMRGTAIHLKGVTTIAFSRPYLEFSIGFLVADHRREEFERSEDVVERRELRIAMPDVPYYQRRMQLFLPNAELIPVHDFQTFLDDESGRFDAMIVAAEIASSWSLLNPSFGVVVPEPPFQKLPMAYSLPLGEFAWIGAVDTWIELKRSDGTLQQLYDHWILGREAEQRGPRWSVVRDVLHWVD